MTRRRWLGAVLGAVVAAAAVALVARAHTPKAFAVRPLTLEIVDAETGRALPGVRVHRCYKTDVYSLSSPMCPQGHRYWLATFTSDPGGRVRMPREELVLGRSEYLTHEEVFVNLDLAPGDRLDEHLPPEGRLPSAVFDAFFPGREGRVTRPAAAYRGYVVDSVEWDWDLAGQGSPERPVYDVLWNSRGLTRPEETIVVRLRRYDPSRAP